MKVFETLLNLAEAPNLELSIKAALSGYDLPYNWRPDSREAIALAMLNGSSVALKLISRDQYNQFINLINAATEKYQLIQHLSVYQTSMASALTQALPINTL